MTLEIIHGQSRERSLGVRLADQLSSVVTDGTVYLGYPVLATADVQVQVDALLVSPDRGLAAFQISSQTPSDTDEWAATIARQDELYNALESHLGRHGTLRRGRNFAVDIETVTVFPSAVDPPDDAVDGHYCSLDELPSLVESFGPLDSTIYKNLEAALQRVTTIKPAKRRADVAEADSRGAVLKRIEKGIANLDFWQKQAAIESPDAPQRIRGLAGSGKTIVLALKAAYLHTQNPEWNIAVTFQTRSLYQQFEDLITRFAFEHSNDQPDFNKLQIAHAWGSSWRDGFYRLAAEHAGHPARDWNYARSTFGSDNAFAGVCAELIEFVEANPVEPIFDAVLIDEAQDLPSEFFRLAYALTSDPKRIVFAYDELQNLSDSAMPAAGELFGRDAAGRSLVAFENIDGEARRDILLPVCYRNSPWALTLAHALGFGIYRDEGLVQHFDDPDLWREIGYTTTKGTLARESHVRLVRSAKSTPTYFKEELTEADAVVVRTFASEAEQDGWVADQIAENLGSDELEADDILVVLPNAYSAKSRAVSLSKHLAGRGIAGHLVGVGSSVDEVFLSGSVALAHIHRAKGNEAPMVYILDAQYGAAEVNPISRRNVLFTAITRSRAWVRMCGHGSGMDALLAEVAAVRLEDYHLEFDIPSDEDLQHMRRIAADRAGRENEAARRVTKSLDELLEEIDNGTLDIADVPPRLRRRLLRLLRGNDADLD